MAISFSAISAKYEVKDTPIVYQFKGGDTLFFKRLRSDSEAQEMQEATQRFLNWKTPSGKFAEYLARDEEGNLLREEAAIIRAFQLHYLSEGGLSAPDPQTGVREPIKKISQLEALALMDKGAILSDIYSKVYLENSYSIEADEVKEIEAAKNALSGTDSDSLKSNAPQNTDSLTPTTLPTQ